MKSFFKYGRRTKSHRRPLPGPGFPVEGFYDPRRGAAAYAPNIALFGSLTAPAIIVFFQVPKNGEQFPDTLRSLAVGLLVIGLIGSLLGSYALAAIGAEDAPTANIAPAIMYAAVSVVASMLSVVSAFEVLVSVYLPKSVTLFVLLIAGASLFGVTATTFALGDSPGLGPRDPEVKKRWFEETNVWLRGRDQAYRSGWWFTIGGATPIVAAIILRLSDPAVVPAPTQATTNTITGVGMAFALLGSMASLNRTAHPARGRPQKALTPLEAWLTTSAVSIMSTMLIILLPG